MSFSRFPILLTLFLGFRVPTAPTAEPVPQRPSIVVLVAPGLGWEEAEAWGRPGSAPWPALARIRTEGTSLRRYHANPLGAPGHAELLTGRHLLRNGVSGNLHGEQRLHGGEITLAEVCAEAGYATGFFGWWRLGLNDPQHPTAQGFGTFVGQCRSDWDLSRPPWLQTGSGPESAVDEPTDNLARAATGFVSEPRAIPFLCWASAPPGPEGRAFLDRIAASVEGNEEVLTVLIGDCPEVQPGHRLFGGTGSLSEAGVRAVSFWRWPGAIPASGTVHEIAANVDVFQTLAHFAGASPPSDRRIDGWNLVPLLLSEEPLPWPDRDLATWVVRSRDVDRARISYRTTNWLAVRDPDFRRAENGDAWELYELLSDPLQQYEVGETYPFILARLKSDAMRWFLDANRFGLSQVPVRLNGPPARLRAEEADATVAGQWRWPVRVEVTTDIRTEWDGPPDWEPDWELRIGDVDVSPGIVGSRIQAGPTEIHLSAPGLEAGDWELRIFTTGANDASDSR